MASESPPFRLDVPWLDRGELLTRYREHLVHEKGLAYPTVAGYQTVACQFLNAFVRHGGAGLSQLSAKFVTEFVIDATDHRPTGTTKHRVTALGSLLRFLYLDGGAPNLVGVVPLGATRARLRRGTPKRPLDTIGDRNCSSARRLPTFKCPM